MMSRGWSALHGRYFSFVSVVLVLSSARTGTCILATARLLCSRLSGVVFFKVKVTGKTASHLIWLLQLRRNLQQTHLSYNSKVDYILLITKVDDNGGIAVGEGNSREESIGNSAV